MDVGNSQNDDNGSGSLVERADRTCSSCKRSKRRCDKKLPSCTLCLRLHRDCDYDSLQQVDSDDISYLRFKILELEERILGISNQPPSISINHESTACYPILNRVNTGSYFPPLFIDSDMFAHCNFTVPTFQVPVPEEIWKAVHDQQDIEALKTQYFQTVHAWLPIINRARFNRLTERMQREAQADLALLLLCMRLVLDVPHEQATHTLLYRTSKKFHFELGMSGLHSLLMLQAGLLISVYELGHSILPAAYISIGNCARQGIALGIHDKSAPQILRKPRGWADWEERERKCGGQSYVTVGGDGRPLCTEDPSKNTLVPADDAAWERGDMVLSERVFVSSTPSTRLSSYARLALACNMLGRVIRHCNDESGDIKFALQNMSQLQRTISSLFDFLAVDTEGRTGEFYDSSAICLSALMKLCEHHSCDSFVDKGVPIEAELVPLIREGTEHALQIMKETSIKIALSVQVLEQQLMFSGIERISPLVLHCIYRGAIALSWLAVETGDEQCIIGKSACQSMLQKINARWKAAGAYLGVLESAEKELEQRDY